MMVQTAQLARISFLLDSLSGGGAEQVILNLASGFAERGHPVDLLVCKMRGALRDKVPTSVNVVPLKAASALRGILSALHADPTILTHVAGIFMKTHKLPGTFRSLPAIVDYLKASRPIGLLSALPKSNVNAVLARHSTGGATRIVVGVHVNYSAHNIESDIDGVPILRHMDTLIRRYYPEADAIVGVSKATANDIAEYLGLPRGRVTAVYNPIATRDIQVLARRAPDHPWFEPGNIPVILGIGRLVAQKDFPLLLRAFSRVRKQRPVRLVLLGGDETSAEQCHQRQQLIEQAERLVVRSDFDMPGFMDNPFSYLSRASVFVLSSRYEGFGNVLVEALLCGCPVVSTDCPSGPAEILADGRYGILVPVGDEHRLADAICSTLNGPPDRGFLKARGNEFSIENAVQGYRQVLFNKTSRAR
jgi:glycosyltransferase involved in cell wall biosynthesis